MTPHASFAKAPFSLRREKKPGIPRNLRDFMNDVAFTIYTFPIVCKSCEQVEMMKIEQDKSNVLPLQSFQTSGLLLPSAFAPRKLLSLDHLDAPDSLRL